MLAACFCLQGAGPVRAAAILPLSPGNTWTYQDLDGKLETMVIKGVVMAKGVPLVEASYGDRGSFFYILSKEGLFRLQPSGRGGSDPPAGDLTLLVREPLEPGRTWQSSWSDPPLFFEVLSRGSVSVTAGTFPNTIKIGYRPATDPIFAGFIWINPDVGIVAQEQSGYRSELVSYSLSELLPPADIAVDGTRLASMFQLDRSEKKKPSRLSFLKQILNWLNKSGVPFGFFLILLALFFSVVYLIMRSGRREIDLADDREVIEGHLTLSSAMVREGLYEEAARILQRLTTRHPQWPDIAALLGKAYRNTGKLEETRLELKRALTLNPDMSSARLDLVRVYLDLDDPARALTEVDAILTSNERFADALYCRGEALQAMGNHELAIEAYREALSINPEFRQAQEGLEKCLSE